MEFFVDRYQFAAVDMGINFSGGDIGVSEHFLNSAQISAVCQQMAGKGVAQRVRMNTFDDACPLRRQFDHLPESFSVKLFSSE